ncbi:MAG TPA: EAL domain-containing protein [Ideonella sp.]|uniref:EAL domain-containing protein n=1 Tax=Ideonella sp. TaxID=1929293 RepID=UPI002D107082|nr:EAL domain-containing protein [Ideonella sp.]HSI51808.1 EAL domain-containing protein [Ideonella sp.]
MAQDPFANAAQARLDASRAAALLDQAQVGLVVVDADGLRFANPAALRLLGDAPGRPVIGRSLLDFIAQVDRAHVAEQIRRRLAGEPGSAYDVRCRRTDGSEFDARLFGQRVMFDGHHADLVTLTDVTELKDALRRSEWTASLLARSESLCRSGSFEVEWPSGRLLASQGLRELTGSRSTPVDLVDTVDMISWVPPDERGLLAAIWRNAVVGEPFELQHRLLCADGERLVVLHRGILQAGAPGQPPRGLALIQDITRQHEAEHRIQELANFDEVTGLPNRSSLLDQLDARAHTARWDERGFCLISIDVPRITELRATMGFGAGDSLAMTIAARLSRMATEQEVVAHVGGSEFAVMRVFDGPAAQEALHLRAQALQAGLQEAARVGPTEVFPLCHIGIAMFPADGEAADALLEAAQTARLGAEAAGGVAFARPESNALALREMQLAGALRHALVRNELSLRYQPQVSLATGAVIGAEALLRWRSAKWGDVSPVEFIQVAERSGLIGAIGDWVLRRVCEQSVIWRQEGLPPVRLAVNFSPLQFQQGDVARQVQRTLLETGADPACLGMELTESTLMENPERAAAMLRELRALGIEISLDDFGTGFSSLSCLRRLPIDVVKIDRSFVQDMTNGPESVSMARAIITMAQGLKMQVLAEGVETEDQLALLVAKGCDQMQGYLFSRPITADEMAALLREGRRLPEDRVRGGHKTRTLLLVDDDVAALSALRRLFRREGYRVLTAASAAEGRARLSDSTVDVMLCDPGLPGPPLLAHAQQQHPEVVRIALAGPEEWAAVAGGASSGALHQVAAKPWDETRLCAQVAQAFHQQLMGDDHRRLQDELGSLQTEVTLLRQQLAGAQAREEAQDQLLQARSGGMRDLVDQLPLAVLGLDPDGLLVYANEQAHLQLPEAAAQLGLPAGGWLAELTRPGMPAVISLPASDWSEQCFEGRPGQVLVQPLRVADGSPRGHSLVFLPKASPPAAS